MGKKRALILTTACCLLSLSPATSTLAEEEFDNGAVRCINGKNIARTLVIDNQNIIFYMRDNIIYHNGLPRHCVGLASAKTFSYRSNVSRLCSIDVITVMNSPGGGLSRAPSCGLGDFLPISAGEAEALIGEPSIESEMLPPAETEEPNPG